MSEFLVFPAAAVLGLLLGIFGSGGSILALPLLLMMGVSTRSAVAGSLVLVGITAAFSLGPYLKKRQVCVRNAVSFLLTSLPASWLGSRASFFLPEKWTLLLFVFLAFSAAWHLWFALLPRQTAGSCNPHQTPLMALGAGIGFVTGLVGVGGGFLMVPAFILFGNMTMDRAPGTALLAIAANCAIGFLGYFGRVDIPWKIVIPLIGVAVPLSWVGMRFANIFPKAFLQKTLAGIVTLFATVVLFRVFL